MHAGLEGLMSQMYLKNLAHHVRRGQAGRVCVRDCPAVV
jgi:hypothetical protein